MASEHVIAYRDIEEGRELRLDLNNGYVYDLQGNQIAKWDPADSTDEVEHLQMLADRAEEFQRRGLNAQLRGSEYTTDVLMKLGQGVDPEKLIARDPKSSAFDGSVLMDLGTSDVHLPAALPNFAGGYRQYAPVADLVSPPVLVSKPADKYFVFQKEDAFQIVAPTVGAAGGQPAEVPPRLQNFTFSTTEYALGGFIATQLAAAADAPLNLDSATLKRVLNALMIRREMRVANLVTTSANWNSTNVASLGSGFQWDGGASSDPIKDLQTRIEQSFGDPTCIVMSEPTWHAFQRNPAVQKYFTYKNSAKPLPDSAEMSAILELPPIYVARMKYLAPAGGALTYVWGTSVLLVRLPDQMPPVSQDDISTSYTFRWNVTAPDGSSAGMDANRQAWAGSGGFVVRRFFNQLRGTMGGSQLVVAHHDAEVMTSQYVGGLITGAYR